MSQKIALITGANKGIGLETARQLGALGMTVLLGARDLGRGEAAAQGLRDQGIDAHAVQLDVTDDASVAAAAERIGGEHGRLDVLVNNAGVPSVMGERRTPSQTSIEDMRGVYETNVFGLVRVTNALFPLLRRSPSARIVFVSSEMGSIATQQDPACPYFVFPASAQYPSSKAAVNMLTAMYAKELESEGIKVNAANPGFTDTDFTSGRGTRSVTKGAEPSVHLATQDDDGPTGILWGHIAREGATEEYGSIPW